MKRALIVGIDEYQRSPLIGCVQDAANMHSVLARNEDESLNFETKILTAPNERVTRSVLMENLKNLFEGDANFAVFYFSGHGTINEFGGYLVTQDASTYEAGISMTELLTLASKSKVKEVLIILDCCFSGDFGSVHAMNTDVTLLRPGVSILTASTASQVSMATSCGSVFTNALVGAMKGGAADIMGKVTVASIYAYVDQVLGSWGQRPLFKSNLSVLTPLRICQPAVSLTLLRKLPKYFKSADFHFPLDPSYEPTAEPKHLENEAIFGELQRLRAARLVVPLKEDHLYYAAMNSTGCCLTYLGQFYWQLASENKL